MTTSTLQLDVNKFHADVKEIAECTAINDHCEALVLGAELLGDKDIGDRARELAKKRDEVGYLTHSLYLEKHEVYNDLMRCAKGKLIWLGLYEEFHGAY